MLLSDVTCTLPPFPYTVSCTHTLHSALVVFFLNLFRACDFSMWAFFTVGHTLLCTISSGMQGLRIINTQNIPSSRSVLQSCLHHTYRSVLFSWNLHRPGLFFSVFSNRLLFTKKQPKSPKKKFTYVSQL